MNTVRKIQPKFNTDLDLDALTQKIKETKTEDNLTESAQSPPSVKKPRAPRVVAKTVAPPIVVKKKAGRKKIIMEEMHRFAIDLPVWLYDKIRKDADDNFSTVRGQILKHLLAHYKE